VRRTRCGGCGSGDLRQFLDLGETPLGDDFPASAAAAAEQQRYPLGAVVCGSCWLVQLTEVVPDEVLWGGDYGFHTGASPSSLAYFEAYAGELAPHAVDGFVVEVACNDGTLLQHLVPPANHVLGVEPAKGPAEAARARDLDVIQEPFGRDVAQAIVDTEGQASLVIANNVLAHVADLDDFVGGLALLLAPDGVLSVEVQDVDRLLLGNGFDLVYHEHRSFFGPETLASTLGRHGLVVRETRRTPAQGGSLRVLAERVTDLTPTLPAARFPAMLDGMQARADRVRADLRDLIAAERAAGRTVVGYGAPAKATTLLHWCGFTADDIEVVYDATPSKNGRYMPGTDIRIWTASTLDMDDADRVTALLLAHNYLPGVLRRERAFVDGGGRFLVPLPVPVVI
jgi:SAM-dependent methyltransferase